MDIINTNAFYKNMNSIKSKNKNIIFLQKFIKANTIKEGEFYNIHATDDIYLYLSYMVHKKI